MEKNCLFNMLKPGQLIATFITKKDRVIKIRVVDKVDGKKLYNFFHPIVNEDVYLAKSPQDNVTLNAENKYLKEQLKCLKKNEGLIIVGDYDNKIIGSISLRRKNFRSKHIGEVGIAISSDFRNEGIGLQLFKILEKLAGKSHYQMLYLTCFAINEKAIRLYEKFGFKKCGLLPKAFLYKDKYEDQVMMYKEI